MKKNLIIMLTSLLCLMNYSCHDSDKSILKQHKATVSSEGGTVIVKGNDNFFLSTVQELVDGKYIYRDVQDVEDIYEGEWYKILMKNKEITLEIQQNSTDTIRSLIVSVSNYVNYFEDFTLYQNK